MGVPVVPAGRGAGGGFFPVAQFDAACADAMIFGTGFIMVTSDGTKRIPPEEVFIKAPRPVERARRDRRPARLGRYEVADDLEPGGVLGCRFAGRMVAGVPAWLGNRRNMGRSLAGAGADWFGPGGGSLSQINYIACDIV